MCLCSSRVSHLCLRLVCSSFFAFDLGQEFPVHQCWLPATWDQLCVLAWTLRVSGEVEAVVLEVQPVAPGPFALQASLPLAPA